MLNVFGVKAIIQDGHKELCSMFFDHGAVCYKGDEVSVTTGRLTADSKEIGSILDIIRSEEANGQSSKEDMFKFNLKFQEKKIESWAASVLFVYNQSFLDNFISYWISFAAEISSPDNAVATQQDTSDSPSGFDYLLQVHLSTPIVVLKALESPDSLRIYLGNLEVNNDASDLPKLNMILSNISAKSFIEGNKRNIINDSTINASLRIKSTGGVDLDMVSEELMMSVGKHQVRLLCDVVDMLSGQGQSTSGGEAIAKSEAGTSPSVAQVSSSETIIGLNIKRFQFDIMGKTDDVNISRLKISEIVFGFKMSAAASLIKASIRGLCLSDTRGDETICYREVIPCSEKSDINIEYDLTGSMLIIDVDKPVFIFVPDLVFTIRNLVLEAYSDSALAKKSASTPASNKAVSTPNASNTAQFHYRIHIKNASVLLIRDTHVKNSDVLLVTVRECVLAQESILSFAVHEAMASMSQIEKEALHNFEADADSESRLGIIQKFDFTFIQDSRSSDSSVLKNIMSVDLPSQLNIFLSFRDIYLIRAFLDKLGEYTGENYSLGNAGQSAIETAKSYYMNNTGQSVATSINDKPLITNDESFHLNFNGLRLLLIDDLENFHLPVVEGVIEGIDLNASSWSEGLLSLSTTINLGLSYYNVKNSHWEPIVEPMNIQLDIVNNSVVNVTSENTLDFTLTTSLIETMIRLANQFSTGMNLNSISSSRTSLSAPFLIRNETGFKVKVSWEAQNSLINEEEDIPWSFEDLRLIRKVKDRSLDSKVHKLTVEVKTGRRDLYFNQLTNVRIDRVGTTYYSLSPTVKDVSYSLQVDVALRGNIKVVSIRSTVVLVNYSNTSLEVLVEPNGNTNNNAEMFILEKGEKHCVSLRNILDSTIRFRPGKFMLSKPLIARSSFLFIFCSNA
jgi:vacuolar protein sorting-associated protein 13A/C